MYTEIITQEKKIHVMEIFPFLEEIFSAIAYQGRKIIDHVDFKAQTNGKFYSYRRKVVIVDRISRGYQYCVKSQKSFIGLYLGGVYFFGGANAFEIMCTCYKISYVNLLHLPMNKKSDFRLPELFSQMRNRSRVLRVI